MNIFLIFLFSIFSSVGATHITTTRFLRDGDVVTSGNSYFNLGFFSPINSTNRYVGIWYSTDSNVLELVWVANRDKPLKDSSGLFRLSEDGNLQVLDGQNKVYWSSNSTFSNVSNSSAAQLQDSGNLLLFSNVNQSVIIWQSFDHPTNTLLPQMKFSNHADKGKTENVIQSWKNLSDPSSGQFTMDINSTDKLTEIFIWNDGKLYFRTGPWNGNFFLGVPPRYYWGLTNGFTQASDSENLPSLMFTSQDSTVREHYELSNHGSALHKQWNKNTHKMEVIWSSLASECDVYGKCGPFGVCNSRDSPMCTCLDGFEPTDNEEWIKKNWTSGCSRRKSLTCGTMKGKKDGFLKLQNMKIPSQADWSATSDEIVCRIKCETQCSCLAYAYYLGIGCMTWKRPLIDIQEYNTSIVDLYIRLAHSELAGKNSKRKTIVVAVVITGIATLAVIGFFTWRCRNKRIGKGAKRRDQQIFSSITGLNFTEVEFKDLPLFTFQELAVATNNFHLSYKLGQGGFGLVFKGKLEDGQEIAVKRLSSASGQGPHEFMNEVLLISKLQHRNLVRLLGCCIEGQEKLLVYEYMSNKSLGALLFDPLHSEILDWNTRANIIEGICRGLLYLHRDSRLRIIHRDLKASNILLDEDLNPKISDFGMAKILFGGKENHGKTSRVVGTYGYMSPEYAMEGRFSEKSDVYSFGVLLLEIVTGRRNSSFNDDDKSFSLIGHVWMSWNEDDVLSLIDPAIANSCPQVKVLKCIHIGLLCVQEFPENRPTISAVLSMLDSETSNLPYPMQPGFSQRRYCVHEKYAPIDVTSYSLNEVSITIPSGR